ncbi:MAG: Omp28-related outer membrane protein [Gemmatimonadota bacterium]|nr:MAG: Omp28-related outer membrane protein [Gemmatimonadota bacterium]
MAVLEQLNAEDLALISYHVWWPSPSDPFYNANREENEARVDFYPEHSGEKVWYVPRLFFDGVGDDDAYDMDDPWELWVALLEQRSQQEIPLEMTLGFDLDGSDERVQAHITSSEEISSPDVVIQFVLTESEIEYEASNGLLLHDHVMRKMYPDGNGQPFSIQEGQSLDISRNFTLDPEWIPEHCGFVVFVQDTSTFEVIQATKSRIFTAVSILDLDLLDTGGDGDSNFEMGEMVDVTFSVRNYGPLATGVSATLTSDDPDISILTSDVQLEDIPLNSTVDNATAPLVLQVSQNVEVHYTHLTVTVRANGGQASSREVIEILIGKPDILIVNDDHSPSALPWGYNAEKFYTMALYDRGETYHVWNTPSDGTPAADLLTAYDIVIWFTGVSDPTIKPEEEAVLTAYLDAGGNLLISGQDIASDLQGSSFLRDYLRAEFVADSSNDVWLDPVPDDPIAGQLNLLSIVSGDYGAANQNSPDEIVPLEDAYPVLTYRGSDRTAALRYIDNYKIVYFAIGFEAIVEFHNIARSFDLRADVLQRIFGWFQTQVQMGDVNCDGTLDVFDLVRIANIILGIYGPTPTRQRLADVNQDGTIDLQDVMTLVNVILET